MAQAARSMVPHPPGVKDGDSGWARIREQNARYWPRFSDSEYQRRYREIRKLMAARGIDCLIMMSSGYLSSANLIYVANYIDILHGVVVFPFEEEPTVFALAYSFAAQAAVQSVIEDVRWGAAINHGAIVDRLREGGFERATIGICDSLPHDMWLYLREALPEAKLIDRFYGFADGVNCLAGTHHNAGEVNVTYASPDFGSGSGLMEYETPAIGGEGGNCSVTTDRLCVIDTDCPSGESCARTDGAFALRYRIETIEPCGNAAVVERFSGCRQASSEAACVGLGGSWGRGGLSTVPFCTCATGQDGCPCSAPEDCRGFCVAEGVIPAECGGAVRGTCVGYSPLFGCFCTFGESGTAAELCVD